ncbi:ThuA domain-containing protein [Candidatus Sumerlaeota bacterium]|nr:ThuA domain-containing protein [Candidatus Sumerlaeota bacterium]
MSETIRVIVWNENVHEQKDEAVRQLYPDGMHSVIAGALNQVPGIKAETATLQEPEHGLTEERLAQTDVLVWWGHCAHHEVDDAVVERVQRHCLQGLGLVALHSAHRSKILMRLLGTSCAIRWRESGEKERLWVVEPGHPIAEGIGEYFELPQTEMYGERFDIPAPEKTVFISWFEGGEVFRSGCCWERGNGRIFYFRPGHEEYPVYYNETVHRVIANACRWAKPRMRGGELAGRNTPPLENRTSQA